MKSKVKNIKYNHLEIEKKWQKRWEENGLAKIDKDDTFKEKFYILDMFPYPSGDGLHMGHAESYTSTDIVYRYKRMRGFNVIHPQGFDSFGLPAENYAIKTGVHPKDTTKKNIENYIRQMRSLAFEYDFDEKIITSMPEYYKWTQWIFTKFFEKGLVYKKIDTINWCDSCKTGLANEQVEDGKCERCKNEVEQRKIPGWFFKITDFADQLIEDLKTIDWPEHTKKNQINWIGKSEGVEIDFNIKNTDKRFSVFTTRPDTLFGVTYCVFAPENKLILDLKGMISNWEEVEKYISDTNKKTERDRLESKEKTGVKLEGIKVVNPVNKEEIPIFIADYVLSGYGTDTIMAVPAYDDRDLEFAQKFNLPVVKADLVSSDEIIKKVRGKKTVNYRLRDWSISRQRYWGAPIPIVYDLEGNAHAVPEKYLPWTLPEDVNFIPTGIAPLAGSKELKKRTEKIFGQGWTPEIDTMDTFVCSSWYYLRYPDPNNDKEFCSSKRLEHWLPVDLYIGGVEHTYMHLLYARFFTKAMQKSGLVNFSEPFLKLRHQGMVLDKEGVKMSKSKGNVVGPDTMVERFGADAVRLYMMFAGPLDEDVIWNENNIVGTYRFLEKVWRLQESLSNKISKDIESEIHKTIKKVTEDIEELKFNTAIATMMSLVNTIAGSSLSYEGYKLILKLLAPFSPHMTEELWYEVFGHKESIHLAPWPEYNEEKIKKDYIIIAIQVNGKVRGELKIKAGVDEVEIKKQACALDNVQKWVQGEEIKKIIYVKDRLVNIVI